MIYSWATRQSQTAVIADIGIGKKMAINIYHWCWDMRSWKLINGPDIKLGGPGQIVQINVSVFTHRERVYNNYVCTYRCIMQHDNCLPIE